MNKLISICVFCYLIILTGCSTNQTIEDISQESENVSITEIDEVSDEVLSSNVIDVDIDTPAEENPFTEITIGGAGDIMCHYAQLKDASAASDGNGYSFYHWFKYIKPALEYPDLMIANLEGPIAGEEPGYHGYPRFNFPDEIVDAIKDAGIDVLTNANNHIMDQGLEGLERTIDVLEEANMYHTGAWKSQEEKNKPLVIDIKGIKVGIVAVTYGVNQYEKIDTLDNVPSYAVCSIKSEEVEKQINLCKEYGVEVIVVCAHMGVEGMTYAPSTMKSLGEKYVEMGADIIFAHHPHVVQSVKEITAENEDGTSNKGIVFWSLGNFVSCMDEIEGEAGVIGYVHITKDNTTGEIDITGVEYLPTWTWEHRYGDFGNMFSILPAGTCIDNPEFYDDLNVDIYADNRIKASWEMVTGVMGEDVATPLRDMPE